MATSGTTDFAQTSREIITQAMILLQALAMGDTPQAEEADYAKTVLNQMVKTWGAAGRLWLTEEGSVTLLASTASYALTLAHKVYSVRRRLTSDTSDLELTEDSRSDYYARPNKASEGSPLSWYFDPQRATKTLFVWPVPTTAIAASTTLKYTYARYIENVDALDDEPDVPQEWLEALTYGLAKRIGPAFGAPATIPQEFAEIKDAADRLYGALTSADQEQASILLSPQMC